MRSVRKILLGLVVVNGLAAVAIWVLVGLSAAFRDTVIYSEFHEVVTKDGFNAPVLKTLSSGSYSSPEDWLDRVVLGPLREHAAAVQWVWIVPAFNAVVCLYVWLMIDRKMRLFRSRLASGVCTECGFRLTGNTSGTCPECGAPVLQRWRTAEVKGGRCAGE